MPPSVPVCSCALFAQFCTRDRGCSEHPAFPAPSYFWAYDFFKTSGASRREIAESYSVKATSLRANGAALRADPLARNDDPFTRNNSQEITLVQTAPAIEWRLRLISALDVNGWAAKPPPMSPAHNNIDHTVKSRVAAISVFASAGMATAKFAVGIAIGSLALISEALHSSVDVVATVITWLVVRVSDRPADDEHHYGHGKFESLSALGVIAMLYVLAGGILVESYSRLREGAPPPTISAVPFIVLLIDIPVNFWRARALHRAARDTKSQALAADALHFASDVLGSIAVMVGLALSGLGYAWGDAAAAIAVAVVISSLGLRLARSTVETLLDRAPEGPSQYAIAPIRAVPGVGGVRPLRMRMVGSTHFIDAIVQVPRTYPIDRVEEIKRKAQDAVSKVLDDADLTFTAVPVARDNESIRERIMVIARNSGVAIHHVTVHDLGGKLTVSIDLEVDGEKALNQAHDIAQELERNIRDEL